MDPAGSAQQGCKKLAQTLKKLLQREQVLLQLQKDLDRQQEDLARRQQQLNRRQQLDQPPPWFPLYDGNPGGCRGFLLKFDLECSRRPITLSSDRSRIAYMIILLSGKALALATAFMGEARSRVLQPQGFSGGAVVGL